MADLDAPGSRLYGTEHTQDGTTPESRSTTIGEGEITNPVRMESQSLNERFIFNAESIIGEEC
jgi:hypothetical protein